ncbi:MAG: tetratricopeptide repeat protein [Rhodospirillales bacterium]
MGFAKVASAFAAACLIAAAAPDAGASMHPLPERTLAPAGVPLEGAAGLSESASFDEGLAAYRAGDFKRARRIWLTLAMQGHPVAQNNLGTLAERPGPGQDFAEAAAWYAKAAESGYALGQHNLAVMYSAGRGVAQDYALARRWFAAAGAQGKADSLTNLGLMEYRGQGGPKDPTAGIRTLTRAAELGSVIAQYDLGALYEAGDGMPADYGAAAAWYRAAAAHDFAPALTGLGALYLRGRGVPKDPAAGAASLRRAAELGDAKGQYLLAVSYLNGAGVARDHVAALKWFAISAARGHAEALRQRDELVGSMNRRDVAEALERARQWAAHATPNG